MVNEKFRVIGRDYHGKTVFDITMSAPMQFPYLFYQDRLFVVSRDEPGVLLERSYMVLKSDAIPTSETDEECH